MSVLRYDENCDGPVLEGTKYVPSQLFIACNKQCCFTMSIDSHRY